MLAVVALFKARLAALIRPRTLVVLAEPYDLWLEQCCRHVLRLDAVTAGAEQRFAIESGTVDLVYCGNLDASRARAAIIRLLPAMAERCVVVIRHLYAAAELHIEPVWPVVAELARADTDRGAALSPMLFADCSEWGAALVKRDRCARLAACAAVPQPPEMPSEVELRRRFPPTAPAELPLPEWLGCSVSPTDGQLLSPRGEHVGTAANLSSVHQFLPAVEAPGPAARSAADEFVVEVAPTSAYESYPPTVWEPRSSRYPLVIETWPRGRRDVPAEYLCCVGRAAVAGVGCIVTADNRIVTESLHDLIGHPDEIYTNLQSCVARTERGEMFRVAAPVRHVAEPTFLVKKESFHNWGHWAIELLPKVKWLTDFFDDTVRVAIGDYAEALRVTVVQSLVACGIAEDRVIYLNGVDVYEFDRLFLSTPVCWDEPQLVAPRVIEFLQRLGRQHFSLDAPERIFVLRAGVSHRIAVNERELIEIGRQFGLVPIDPASLTFTERVRVFSNARLIAGVHGAGLTDLVFSQHHAAVVMLGSEQVPDDFFWNISCIRGDSFHILTGDMVEPDPRGPLWSNYQIDPASFARLLRHLLDTGAPAREPADKGT